MLCLCCSRTLAPLKSPSVTAWPQAWVHFHSAQGSMALAVPWAVVWLMGRRGAASSLHPFSLIPENKPM